MTRVKVQDNNTYQRKKRKYPNLRFIVQRKGDVTRTTDITVTNPPKPIERDSKE